jgi:hypothetical protein
MEKFPVEIYVFDKHLLLPTRGIYDPETRLATVRRGWREKSSIKFYVDPDHIYRLKRGGKEKRVIFVDNATRRTVSVKGVKTIINPDGSKQVKEEVTQVDCAESVQMHSDEEMDLYTATSLDVLTERSFWKALLERHKIPLSTTIILLLAGMGVYHIILLLLRAFGVHV